MPLPRKKWNTPLASYVGLPDGTHFATFRDVRDFIDRRLPAEWRRKLIWRQTRESLEKAAESGDAKSFTIGLKLTLILEGCLVQEEPTV